MNHFYLTLMVFFVLYCSSQSEPLKPILNTDSGHRIRCNTYSIVYEITYIWTIHEFSRLEALNTSQILSPKLHAPTTDVYEWDIAVKPNYIYEGNRTIAVLIFLSGKSKIQHAVADSNVSIINHKEETLFYKNQTVRNYTAGGCHGWNDYCYKDDFFRHDLLQNDTLTLLINIKWFSPEFHNNVSHERKIPSPTPIVHESTAIRLNHSHLFESPKGNPKFANVLFATNNSKYESLLENSKFADVVLTINGSSYPAHKAILAANSPTFAAMFQRNNSKNEINEKNKKIRIKITRMNEEVLRAMLQYIYTGRCENLDNLADKLFVAAEKYGLNELKKVCEQTLCTALSTKNAVKMLVFAEKHHANELKFKAAQFIANRSAQKLNTTG